MESWTKIIAVIVVIGAIVGAAYYGVAKVSEETVIEPPITVEVGDRVICDYTGIYSADTPVIGGHVFDTSVESVAADNITYPKSLSFTPKDTYSPLNVYTGTDTAPTGYTTVVAGFREGLIGMELGESKLIVVPAEKGYGALITDNVDVYSTVEELSVINTMVRSEFEFEFGFVVSGNNQNIVHPKWGWNVTILTYDDESVTYRNSPDLGYRTSKPFTVFDSVVTYIDSSADSGKGLIRVQHLITDEMVDNVIGLDWLGRNFIPIGLDSDAGTFTLNRNQEVVGKTLWFQVTVLGVEKGKGTE